MGLLAFILSSAVVSVSITDDIDNPNAYKFYFGDLISHSLPLDDPMAALISKRTSESLFETNDRQEFLDRLQSIHETYRTHPELAERFTILNAQLNREFDKRLAKAKEKRLIYAASGAVIGAIISIPVVRAIASKTSWATSLAIAIPSGVIAGGGAGFLLGHLLKMPAYTDDAQSMTRDLKRDLETLEK